MNQPMMIDVNRLIHQKNFFQNQAKTYHDKYKKALSEMAMIMDANRQLKAERDQTDRTKRQQIEQQINNYRSHYQIEVKNLHSQKNHLTSIIQSMSDREIEMDNLRKQLFKLQKEIQQHLSDKQRLKKDYQNVKISIANPQNQNKLQLELQKYKDDVQQKRLKICQLELQYKELEERDKLKFLEMQSITQKYQAKLSHKQNHQTELKIPSEILEQLSKLRKQNAELKSTFEKQHLTIFQKNEDHELLQMLKKFHQEMNVLRHELNEVKNNREQLLSNAYKEKAESHLHNIKYQKQIQFYTAEIIGLKEKLSIYEHQSRQKKKDDRLLKELMQEKNILESKVFVLEAMKIGERRMHIDSNQVRQFEQHIDALIKTQEKQMLTIKSGQYIQNIVTLHTIVKNLDEQLTKYQEEKEYYIKKYHSSKQKINLLGREIQEKQKQFSIIVDSYKNKIGNYNVLIEKLQQELQKTIYINNQITQNNNYQSITFPLEQKIVELTNKHIILSKNFTTLQNQSQSEKEKIEQQRKKWKMQLEELQTQKDEITKKYRESQSIILEKELSQAASRTNRNYQIQAVEKGKYILKLEEQIKLLKFEYLTRQQNLKTEHWNEKMKLEHEIASLKSQKILISRHYSESRDESQQNSEMREKIKQLEKIVQNLANDDKNEYIVKVCEQLNLVKQNLFQEKNQLTYLKQLLAKYEAKISSSDKDIENYRLRLTEIQDLMIKMNRQIEDKNIQIYRLSEAINLKDVHINRLTERIQFVQQKQISLTNIQLEQNNQLQKQYERLVEANSELQNKTLILQNKIRSLEGDYDKLYDENLQLLYTINNHNIENKEKVIYDEKYQFESTQRIKDLQNDLKKVNDQNNFLKNEIENLRTKLLDRARLSNESLNSIETRKIDQLIHELNQKQKNILFYKEELNKFAYERYTQKDMFENQWHRMMNQIQNCKRTIQELQNREKKNEGRNNSTQITTFKSKIVLLNAQIQQKEIIINDLKQQIYVLKLEKHQGQSVDLKDLRNEINRLVEKEISSNNKINGLDNQIRQKDALINNLRQQIYLIKQLNHRENQSSQRSDKQIIISNLRQEIYNLKLEKQISLNTQETLKLRDDYQKAIKNQKSSQIEINQLRKQIDAKEYVIHTLNQEIYRLKLQNQGDQNYEIHNLKQQIQRLGNNQNRYDQEIRQLHTQIHQRQQKINLLIQQINRLSLTNIGYNEIEIKQYKERQIGLEEKIRLLVNTIHEKEFIISRLNDQLYQSKINLHSTQNLIDQNELKHLRQQIHSLMQKNLFNQNRIRELQQQNSLLKVRRISENSLILKEDEHTMAQTLKQNESYIKLINQKLTNDQDMQKRNEQLLILLVLSYATIDSLQNRLDEQSQNFRLFYDKYTQFLRVMELRNLSQYSTEANVQLIKQVECGHKHFMDYTVKHQLHLRQVNSIQEIDNSQSRINDIESSINSTYQLDGSPEKNNSYF